DRFIADGRKAAVAGQYDEAIKNFDEALKLDANDYNALWGKADVYQRQGNLLEQQKVLEKLNADAYKEYGGVVKPALEDNYRKQAEAIMGGNPDQAEALLRKAIDINKKSDAHQTLAEILERKGDEALKKGDFATAATTFEAAQQLRIAKKMRSKLQGKGEIASFLAFKKSFMPKFDAMKGAPNEAGVHVITEQAVYDPKEKVFVVQAVHQLGRTEPKTDEEKEALGDKILFSPDGVHPYPDSGHELYLQAVIRGMKPIREAGKPGPRVLPEPFVKDNWEAARMVPLTRSMLSDGWQKLDPKDNDLARRFQNRMPEMWGARRPGETIKLRFRGATLRMYDLLGPDCGQVIVRVDDRAPAIKPRFDAYCTYHRLATLSVAEDLPEGIHTVELEIHPDQPDKAAILAQRKESIDNPARYDGTFWYVGSILVLGEVVP
ncbi:MAG: tetratricopeptide repeat protein, partial [Verrucomicrobiae bacterium]|nr:tetratricopeptide repeat protein [Verrucomicrobiae bacterium]